MINNLRPVIVLFCQVLQYSTSIIVIVDLETVNVRTHLYQEISSVNGKEAPASIDHHNIVSRYHVVYLFFRASAIIAVETGHQCYSALKCSWRRTETHFRVTLPPLLLLLFLLQCCLRFLALLCHGVWFVMQSCDGISIDARGRTFNVFSISALQLS